jgi:hypothetical protein
MEAPEAGSVTSIVFANPASEMEDRVFCRLNQERKRTALTKRGYSGTVTTRKRGIKNMLSAKRTQINLCQIGLDVVGD